MDRSQLLNDQEQALRLMLDGRQAMIWTALPCIVKSVDLANMTIEAQPAIQGQVEDENNNIQFVNLPLLLDVPIVFPSCKGFLITMPISAGDEVLVIVASRGIDFWWQSSGIQKPAEIRMHDLSDGFAIPGPRSQPNVAGGISSTALQIRNNAGTSYVEISADGKIKLVSPSEIDVTGNLKVTGTIEATSTITANTLTVPIGLTTHKHGGVTVGSGTSGVPVP